MEKIALAKKLRQFMDERDLTLYRASALTGLSIGTLSLFMRGRVQSTSRTQYKIRKLIGEI